VGAINNGQSRDTGNNRHRRKTNKIKTKTHHRKQRSNTNLTTKLVVNPGSREKQTFSVSLHTSTMLFIVKSNKHIVSDIEIKEKYVKRKIS